MAFNGSAPLNKRPRVDLRNDMDSSHKIKSDMNHGDDPRRKRPENPENCVLLYTIYNAVYPITTEVIHTISSPSGNVLRIVIFKKTGVQAMVEFDSIDSAKRAKETLNGADIYSGCCTLKIEFAKPTKLNVRKNDTESWDYTVGSGFLAWLEEEFRSMKSASVCFQHIHAAVSISWSAPKNNADPGKKDNVPSRPPPLLEEPRFGSSPQPYRSEGGRGVTGGNFGATERFDDFRGGEYGDNFVTDRFNSAHPDRFKREFGRETVPSPMPNRTVPGFRGASTLPTPGSLGVSTNTGPVMMVYGLDTKKLNCDRLFNIFCLYGNVARIKFLKTKEGAAMIQMGDGSAVERCVQHLNNAPLFNPKNRLQLGYSKQLFLSDVTNPFNLPDGTPSFKDFIGNKHNRFVNPAMSLKNRIQSPSRILHFFNTPPTITDEILLGLFEDKKITPPTTVKIFPMKSERSSSGLLEFEDIEGAIEALVVLNHAPIDNPNGKFPYTMKLCFSSSRQVNVNGSSRLQNDGNEANEN